VIEESIGCGQVEELLVQATDELNLVDKYIGEDILFSRLRAEQ
jgi:hypothetical protein